MQELFHDFRSVVHGKNNVFDAGSNESFNLVDNHGLVTELDERLRKGESLYRVECLVSNKCRQFRLNSRHDMFIPARLEYHKMLVEQPFSQGGAWTRETHERPKARAKASDKNKSCGLCQPCLMLEVGHGSVVMK